MFNQIVSTQDIIKHGEQIIRSQKFSVGKKIEVTYLGGSNFSLLEKKLIGSFADGKQKQYKKGQLLTVRAVKPVIGKGVTVQYDAENFGFIEMCEVTDEICGNVFQELMQK